MAVSHLQRSRSHRSCSIRRSLRSARRRSRYHAGDQARALRVDRGAIGARRRDHPRRWDDSSRPRRDARRVGAAGPGDPGRLDDSAPARPPSWDRAAAWRRQSVRDDAADTTVARRVADPVERSGDEFLFTQQIGRAQGLRIVQTGPDPRGGSDALGLQRDPAGLFHWTAERAPDDRTWRREVDIRARRA